MARTFAGAAQINPVLSQLDLPALHIPLVEYDKKRPLLLRSARVIVAARAAPLTTARTEATIGLTAGAGKA